MHHPEIAVPKTIMISEKRPKISLLACIACRRRKSRCVLENKSPPCVYCKKRGLTCDFQQRGKRGPSRKTVSKQVLLEDSERYLEVSDNHINETLLSQPHHYLSVENHYGQHKGIAQTQYNEKFVQSLPCWLRPMSTDIICSRPVFEDLIRVFLKELYPLTPCVHRPTFVKELDSGREKHDPVFLAFLMAMVAYTISTVPRKILDYKAREPNFRYATYRELFAKCREAIVQIKLSPYWVSGKNNSLYHFNTLFLLSMADVFVEGNYVRAKCMSMEAISILMSLKSYKWPSGFHGLNAIEVELRKRTFWLGYFLTTMVNVADEDNDFYTTNLFGVRDIKNLIPAQVDDEYISEDSVGTQPEGFPSLLVGFYHNIMIHSALEFPEISLRQPLLEASPSANEYHVAQLLERVKQKRAEVPLFLCSWEHEDTDGAHATVIVPKDCSLTCNWYSVDSDTVKIQLEIQRSNIGVTQLWLQNMLLEKIEQYRGKRAQQEPNATDDYYLSLKSNLEELEFWKERDGICRNLLKALSSVSLENAEPNGLPLILKLRMMASSLIRHTLSDQRGVLQRAEAYFVELLDIIVHIETHRGTHQESQSWNAFNRL